MSEELSAVATETVDAPEVETAEPIEGEQVDSPVEGEEGEQQEEEQTEGDAEEVDGDGRVIPQQYRELFKTDSKLKAMFFENRELKTLFPGGIPEVREIQQVFADLGGREGVDGLKASKEELGQIDQMALDGDPRLIQRFAEVSPEGFSKSAPAFLSTWNQVDPEGCNATLCGVIANTLRDANIDNQLDRMALLLEVGRTEDVAAAIKGLKEWSGTFSRAATNRPAPKQHEGKQDSKLTEREQAIQEREMKAMQTDITSRRDAVFASVLKPYIDGKNVPEYKIGLMNREILREVNDVLAKDSAFSANWSKAWQSGDHNALFKLQKSKLEEITPEIAKRIAGHLLRGDAPVKPKPIVPAKPVVQKQAPKASGFADPMGDKLKEIFSR